MIIAIGLTPDEWETIKHNYTMIDDNCFYRDFNNDRLYRNSKGERHRTDGPAVISKSGKIYFYAHNIFCKSWEEFKDISGTTDEAITALILKYGEL